MPMSIAAPANDGFQFRVGQRCHVVRVHLLHRRLLRFTPLVDGVC